MFSYWNKQEETRFAAASEFKQTRIVLSEIDKYKNYMESCAKSTGIGTIEDFKHKILRQLLQKINQKIDIFNALDSNQERVTDLEQKRQLVSDMLTIIYAIEQQHPNKLDVLRNSRKEMAEVGKAACLFVPPVAVGVVLAPTGIGTLIAGGVGCKVGDGMVNRFLPTDNRRVAQSQILVNRLKNALSEVQQVIIKEQEKNCRLSVEK